MSVTGVLAVVLAAVVMVRCVCVIHDMHPRFAGHYGAWLGYGLSYAVLCVAAGASAARIVEGPGCITDWLWLTASTGLIAFDRRKAVSPRPAKRVQAGQMAPEQS